MLEGERSRDLVLSHKMEKVYLAAAPQPLRDAAALLLETGLRLGEALALKWTTLSLTQPTVTSSAIYWFVRVNRRMLVAT